MVRLFHKDFSVSGWIFSSVHSLCIFYIIHLSIHPSILCHYPGSGRGGSSLSMESQSLFPPRGLAPGGGTGDPRMGKGNWETFILLIKRAYALSGPSPKISFVMDDPSRGTKPRKTPRIHANHSTTIRW